MKKLILKLDLNDDKDKRKALKTVSTLSGIDVVSIDIKSKTLMVIGTVDPVSVVSKLRKFWPTADIILVGPAKEPEKKEEAKKEEPKKEEAKKEEEKKNEQDQAVVGMIMPYRQYYPQSNKNYYVNHSIEENPNACTIS